MKKIIIILSFVLLVLIVLSLLINYFAKNGSLFSKKNFPLPTSFSNQSYLNEIEKTKQNQQNEQLMPTISANPSPKLFLTGIKTLSPQTITKVQHLKSQLPIDTENFKIDYSYPLEKFIIVKKSPQAEEKLREFFNNDQISYEELLRENFLVFTERRLSEFKEQLEDEYLKIREEKNNFFSPTPPETEFSLSPSPFPSATAGNFNPLIEFLSIFLNFGDQSSNLSSSNPILPETLPTAAQTEILGPSSKSPANLNDIFNEVGQKVGVPPKILEVVMKIEMPATFNLSPQQIANYSAPNQSWPSCEPNICSATGPMQMTIGIDGDGNTLCPRCGVGFCPNAWASYGKAINSFGGYLHQANPCNIRDNVYGSAAKLKNDSKTTDSLNWTQAEVYRAATRYYGSCGDKYRYQRLGNRTYCEYVWDYYKAP